jgi:hypothetical protein
MREEQLIRFLRTALSLQRRRATGVLELSCDEDRARLSFDKGQLVLAEHKSLGRTLGAYMVERGMISRADYEELAHSLKGRPHASPMVSFVEAAVSRRLVEIGHANALLAGQVERNVLAILDWPRFEVRFTADNLTVEQGPRFPVELEALVLSGVRTRLGLPALRAHLDSRMAQYPRTTRPTAELIAQLRLQPAELRATRALDGKRSVAELLEAPELEAEATARVLLVLKLALDLEWSETPGGPGDASDSSPTHSVPATTLGRIHPRSVRMTLPQPPSAKETEAATAFRRGVAYLRVGKLDLARAEIVKAASAIDHPEYRLYERWTEVAGRTAPHAAPVLQPLADAARRALEHDPTMAFAYFVVGHLHLWQKDNLNAELAFRRAAKLDPTDAMAKRLADDLQKQRHSR